MTGGESHTKADLGALLQKLLELVPMLVALVVLIIGSHYSAARIGTRWRQALTRRLTKQYLTNDSYYRVQLKRQTSSSAESCAGSIIDGEAPPDPLRNPDQIIASDVPLLTKLVCGGVSPPLASTLLKLVAGAALTAVATCIAVQTGGVHVTALVFCYLVALLLINRRAARPIAARTAQQEAREGEYRRLHMRLRTYAEAVAMLRGRPYEEARLESALARLIANQLTLVRQYFVLMGFLAVSEASSAALNCSIAAAALLVGRIEVYDVAELTKLLGTLDLLARAFLMVPSTLPELATIGGLARRIVGLHEALSALEAGSTPPPATHTVDSATTTSLLGCDQLTIRLPRPDGTAGAVVVRDLRFEVHPRQSLVVVGDSGIGKSSLLRVLSGLWRAERGTLYVPASTCFAPQRPYFCVGSLRDQLRYPRPSLPLPVPSDDDLRRLLEQLDLGRPLARYGLDEIASWEDVLSGGEQQRLVFARVALARPAYAVMDEPTSALDIRMEEVCMRLLADAGITLLSVAHRPSVEQFHAAKLTMRRAPPSAARAGKGPITAEGGMPPDDTEEQGATVQVTALDSAGRKRLW